MAAIALAPRSEPAAGWWNRSRVLGLSKASCCTCHGYGLRQIRDGKKTLPCHCVMRAIFRACFNRYRACVANGFQTATVDWMNAKHTASINGRAYGRKKEEFIADFSLVSRRSLSEADYDIFR